MNAMAAKLLAIPEGCILRWSTGPEPEFTNSRSVYLLNTPDQNGQVRITFCSIITNLPAAI
jgi:hypothetical protein